MPKKVTAIHDLIVDEVPEFAYITKVWLEDSVKPLLAHMSPLESWLIKIWEMAKAVILQGS